MVCNYRIAFCTNTLHQPQQLRQFDDDFKERYSENKYNYEGEDIVTQTPSGSGEYKDYENAEDNRKDRNDSNFLSINFGPLSWLFYLAIGLAVAYLVYILFNEGGTSLFSSRQHKKISHYQEITAENIETADINSLISNAEKDNNFRLAIRYYYLLILKNLSLKNYIKFEDDKTNSEYLNEVSATPLTINLSIPLTYTITFGMANFLLMQTNTTRQKIIL